MFAKAPRYELVSGSGSRAEIIYHPSLKVSFADDAALILARDGPDLIEGLPRRAVAPTSIVGPLVIFSRGRGRTVLRHGSAHGVEEWLSEHRGHRPERDWPLLSVEAFSATEAGIAAINARLAESAKLGLVPWGTGPAEIGIRFAGVRRPLNVIYRERNLTLIAALQRAAGLKTALRRADAVAFAEVDEEMKASASFNTGTTRGAAPPLTGWIMDSIGKALRMYDSVDRSTLIGCDFAETIDPAYGQFITASYDLATAEEAPIVEDVGALITRRDGTVIETRYRRMIMPFRALDGGRIIVVKSVFIPGQAQAA